MADASYDRSTSFRHALLERELTCVVGIPCKQEVYPAEVAMIFPVASRHARTMCQMFYRVLPSRYLRAQSGRPSAGGMAPRASSQRALLLCASGFLKARRLKTHELLVLTAKASLSGRTSQLMALAKLCVSSEAQMCRIKLSFRLLRGTRRAYRRQKARVMISLISN